MSHPARRWLLEAARATGLPPAEDPPDLDVHEIPWAETLALVRRVGQEPLFRHFLRTRFPDAPIPEDARADLESQSAYHAFRWAEIHDSVAPAFRALAHAGIQVVLLKGIGLVGEIYDPPAIRPMRDVDILVRPDALAEARRVLESSGFRADPAVDASDFAGHHHLPPLFHVRTEVCLEVHHRPVRDWEGLRGAPELEEYWRGLRESATFPGAAFCLDPTVILVVTSIHLTHGDKIGRRAQLVIDLARIVEAYEERIDWDRVRGFAESRDVARSLAASLGYLRREGLASAPSPVLAELHARARLRRWERALLDQLTDRYRIGAPPPWRLVSGRVSNILWTQTLRDAGVLRRVGATLRGILRRG